MTEATETIKMRRQNARGRTLLVEFKAPRGLVEAFDSKVKVHFSSRSEALRSLMRAFLEGRKK